MSLLRGNTRPALALMVVITQAFAACASAPEFDLIVSGGSVFDGSGSDPRRADVGVRGDRIAAIGDLANRTASEIVDASGRLVTPGFIDVDSAAGLGELVDGAQSRVRQGITTELLGIDSPAFWTAAHGDTAALRAHGLALDWSGMNGYLTRLESHGIAVNVGTLVPTSAAPPGAASAAFLDDALRDGAFGVVDDRGEDVSALGEIATRVGQHDAMLVVGIENPAAHTDDALLTVAAKSRRIAVEGLSRLPTTEALNALGRQVVASSPRQTPIYGIVTPYPAPNAGDTAMVTAALKSGSVLIGTHAADVPTQGVPPPDAQAAFGTFPRLLGQFVRDAQVLDLRDALRRITSIAASTYQIRQRGFIRENYFADLVVFDPATIADRATVDRPAQFPTGIDYVVVNGVVVVTPRGMTGSRPGYRLLHGGPAR